MITGPTQRVAAYAGFTWCVLQVAMMLYSGNLTAPSAALNVVPVLLLSFGALRAHRFATIALALYGMLRLWMASPVLSQLVGDAAPMPKHWWIALLAIPFALVWITAGYSAPARRKAPRT